MESLVEFVDFLHNNSYKLCILVNQQTKCRGCYGRRYGRQKWAVLIKKGVINRLGEYRYQ